MLRACLETHCFLRGAAPEAAPQVRLYLASEAGQRDMGQHLFERLADFRASWRGILLQEPCHGSEYAGCTKSALQAMLFPERVLQYGKMLSNTLHGDFGSSLKYQGQPVNTILKSALPVSATIGLLAYLLAQRTKPEAKDKTPARP